MDFRYQSLVWSSDPKPRVEKSDEEPQSLDDLINARCRAGWELQGVYPESTDGSKYRLLFRMPCEAWKLLADFARKNGGTVDKAAEAQAAKALLKDLCSVMEGSGFSATAREQEDDVVVTGPGRLQATVEILEHGSIVLTTISPGKGQPTTRVPLAFNPARAALEPEATETNPPVPRSALDVLVAEILAPRK